MNDRTDDDLVAITARWQTTAASDVVDPQALDDARGDIDTLLAEIARLRRYIADLTPPTKMGMETVPVCCEQLRRYLADPDNVVDFVTELDHFLLPVRGSSHSGIVIAFCPWCGSPLPVPPQDGVGAEAGEGTA